MSSSDQRFSRQDLLTALEQGWKRYLPGLAALSEEEQARFAQAQGFARVQDMLVHIFSWWERSMQRSIRLLNGPPEIDASAHALFVQTIDEFNADVINRYQGWTRAAVEERFVANLAALEDYISHLSDAALEDARIQRWMRSEAIDHYNDHRLASGPALHLAR
jgi:hypothetical protein